MSRFHHRESESTRSPTTFRMQHDQISVRVLTAIDRPFGEVQIAVTLEQPDAGVMVDNGRPFF
jgi:hypothetical protein